jgi:hypothetical protein
MSDQARRHEELEERVARLRAALERDEQCLREVLRRREPPEPLRLIETHHPPGGTGAI